MIDIKDVLSFTSKWLKFHINYVIVGEGFLTFLVVFFFPYQFKISLLKRLVVIFCMGFIMLGHCDLY